MSSVADTKATAADLPAASSADPVVSHWQIIGPVKNQLYTAMMISVISTACSVAALMCLAMLIDSVLSSTAEQGHEVMTSLPLSAEWQWFMAALGLVIAAYLLRGIAFKRSHMAAFALESKLRRSLSQHLATLPLGVLNQHGASKLAKVMQDDVKELHVFVADGTPLYAKAFAAPIISLALMLWLDWRLALVALAVLVMGMVILSFTLSGSADIQKQYNEAREQVSQAVIEFVQAMPVVRTFDSGQASFSRYEQALSRYLAILTNWYRQMGTSSRLSMLILNPAPTLFALIWAGLFWYGHDLYAFSTWLAILLIGTGMAEALMPYMSLYHLIEKVKMSVQRIHDIQALQPLPTKQADAMPNASAMPPSEEKQRPNCRCPTSSAICFDRVSFRYEDRGHNALSHVSFSVPEGSFTAIIGPSGSGKSTIARLILRFWDVSAGSVQLGGVDVRDIDPKVLMSQISVVSQDTFLFSGSIMDNVCLGIKGCSNQQVVDACQAAQAYEFIAQFPQGYDTLVGERGASLSGGQRQRLTIARAILQDRPILILDEATAFADAQNEALLMQALYKLMKGKTVLMIAHRLASIAHADQILVLNQGKLVESGTPVQLKQSQGYFTRLYAAYEQAQNWTMRAG